MVHGLISTLSYAAAGEASSRHKATSPPVQPVPTTQATPLIQPAPTVQRQMILFLNPAFIGIQETLQWLTGNQANQAPISTPAPLCVEPILW